MREYLTIAMLRECISRLEDAARTEVEFEGLVKQWDIRDRKIYEALIKKFWFIDDGMFDWEKYGGQKPQADILDSLFLCICQMHNLTADGDLSRLINKASDKQKEIFFLRVFRGCSPQKIAHCLEMTDRNVRDIMNRVVRNIKSGMFDALQKRQDEKMPLTLIEKEFLNEYIPKETPKGKKAKKPPTSKHS